MTNPESLQQSPPADDGVCWFGEPAPNLKSNLERRVRHLAEEMRREADAGRTSDLGYYANSLQLALDQQLYMTEEQWAKFDERTANQRPLPPDIQEKLREETRNYHLRDRNPPPNVLTPERYERLMQSLRNRANNEGAVQ